MYQEWHSNFLHPFEHTMDVPHIRHAKSRIGCGTRRVKLTRGKDAFLMPALDFVWVDLVRQIRSHQRCKPMTIRHSFQDAVTVSFSRGNRGYRRHQIRHDDSARKLARRIMGDQRHHIVVANMQMPIIRLPNCQFADGIRFGCGHELGSSEIAVDLSGSTTIVDVTRLPAKFDQTIF